MQCDSFCVLESGFPVSAAGDLVALSAFVFFGEIANQDDDEEDLAACRCNPGQWNKGIMQRCLFTIRRLSFIGMYFAFCFNGYIYYCFSN